MANAYRYKVTETRGDEIDIAHLDLYGNEGWELCHVERMTNTINFYWKLRMPDPEAMQEDFPRSSPGQEMPLERFFPVNRPPKIVANKRRRILARSMVRDESQYE